MKETLTLLFYACIGPDNQTGEWRGTSAEIENIDHPIDVGKIKIR